ncbi:HET-domain-containing protein [Earliella scabrosa]|nr:HET-domain-containing protein [Earliella scabrosa]
MWLLSTQYAELEFFPSPEAVTGGYAILSHTWANAKEKSFQDIQALAQRCRRPDGTRRVNPRDSDELSEKIRRSCLLAESHGYSWIWIDTCCIDKTSSTELSEAINSMFRWYSCSEVCYAYLGDVPTDYDLAAKNSAFRATRWHRRGWTLQELIAPAHVIFVSSEWEPLGTKIEYAELLQEITGIWWQVLTREVNFSVISIAQRMSWASQRSTTRVEDEAYSLMGLFNVSMPTIYGEGHRAFQRLQQEIMKQSVDTSLFAWGRWTSSDKLQPAPPDDIYRYFNTSSQNHVYLLARSPRSFERPFGGSIVRFTPSASHPLQPYLPWQWKRMPNEPEDSTRRTQGPFGRVELPRFTVTSYGIECRFPIIEVGGITIAVLLCDTGREHIGLLLHPSNNIIQDPTRKMYNIGYGFRMENGAIGFARLISLGNDLHDIRINDQHVPPAEWRDICIAGEPPKTWNDDLPTLCSPLNSIFPSTPFRIPHWLVGQMATIGFELRPLYTASKPPPNGDTLLVVATFEDVREKESIRICLGMCSAEDPAHPVHWSKAMTQHRENWSQKVDLAHDCAVDHVASWPRLTKSFGDSARTVVISFYPSKLPQTSHTTTTTFVLHLELSGSVFSSVLGRATSLPSRDKLTMTMAHASDLDVKVPSDAETETFTLLPLRHDALVVQEVEAAHERGGEGDDSHTGGCATT